MELAQDLLDTLACPESRQPLIYFRRGEDDDNLDEAFLFCPSSLLRYRIDDGIPVLLVDEAERLDEVAGKRLIDRARELGLKGA